MPYFFYTLKKIFSINLPKYKTLNTLDEHAMHWGKAGVEGKIQLNEDRKPLMECGTGPRQVDSLTFTAPL